MNENICLGSVIQDWYKGSLIGTYKVTLIPLGSMLGNKYALVNIDGSGLANGYFNSLEELKERISREKSWRIFNIDLELLINQHIAQIKE